MFEKSLSCAGPVATVSGSVDVVLDLNRSVTASFKIMVQQKEKTTGNGAAQPPSG